MEITMKKQTLRFLSILMALCLFAPILSSCNGNEKETSTSTPSVSTEADGTQSTEKETDSTSATESVDSNGTETSDTEKETDTESETAEPRPVLEGDEAALIELAHNIKNGVNPHYSDASRSEVTIENQKMTMGYGMVGGSSNMQVSHLSAPSGKSYITNTMDVVLNMQNGKTYHASMSKDDAILNIYRYGFYYYETRLEGQTFMNNIVPENEIVFEVDKYNVAVGVKRPEVANGVLSFRMGADEDPRIVYDCNFAAEDYEYLEITMKLEKNSSNSQIFIIAGSATGYNSNQCYTFTPEANGEFVTYLIPLADKFNDYTGSVRGIRLDLGATVSSTVEIKSIRVFKASYNGAPEALSMQRSFLTYSDKLHHLVQLSTSEKVTGVASVDIVTRIDANTVDKLIVKDKNGTKTAIDGVDWNSCEYVGFDIKNAGIFGYILPYDGAGGSIKVTLDQGVYTVTQSKVPENNELIPSPLHTKNANDFFMGMRIYNDENHDFTVFTHEAECERHPLTSKNIVVDEKYDGAEFDGYDSLRGFYQISLKEGGDFNKSYYVQPNRQFRASFTVTGDEYDRIAYFSTFMDDNGGLECAVLLDEGDLLLPVPIEVCKNFSGDGENTIYNLDDARYCQTFFPMIVEKGETKAYSVAHLYQNWGRFPLKQISSIQYHTPFYHLSTGVTETNCIVPYTEAGPGLPDHRAMSAPLWPTQPQHTSGGSHVFLHYTDENGITNISNTTYAAIDSYGPTYADIELGFITADNRIEAKYTHMEMPQTDENRTYYNLSYTFLDDVSFKDFAREFKFYRVSDNNSTGYYTKVGYLDQSNKSQVVAANTNEKGLQEFILGDNCPYFTFFDMANPAPDSGTAYGYVNVSFLIYNSTIVQDGKEITPNFFLRNNDQYLTLSLNLGEVTFKKGDTITINAIIMPWGSHELDYSGTEPDANVRRVRENTLLNPLKITADADCEVIDSVYLPKVRTTNGESADFTLSGGENNVTVRAYGFKELSVPLIEEYKNGKWTKYEISSIGTPDGRGYGYEYDGYMVHYDGDGTYSYSFVTTMNNGEPRKFRISITDGFRGWPKVPYEENSEISNENDPVNVFVDAAEIAYLSLDILGSVSGAELSEDGSYLRYFGNPGAGESYLKAFAADNRAYDDLEATGQYAVIKYRLPEDTPVQLNNFQFFASTVNDNPQGPEKFSFFDLEHDGEWHVLVIDLSMFIPSAYFNTKDDGSYMAKFFRIDFFNQAGVPENMYIDFEYIALHNNLEEIYKLNENMSEVVLVKGEREAKRIDPKTCNEVQPPVEITESPLNLHLNAEQINNACVSTAKDLFTSITLSEDKSYVRLNAKSGIKEAYATLWRESDAGYESLASTGQYLIFKYRLPSVSEKKLTGIEIYASTESASPTGPDNTDYYDLIHDDKWHVLILDLTKMLPKYCVAQDNGTYKLKFLRFDFFGNDVSNDLYIDIAYIGVCDSIDKAKELNADMNEMTLTTTGHGGEKITLSVSNPSPFNVYIDPESIASSCLSSKLFSAVTVSEDGAYVKLNALSAAKESFVTLYQRKGVYESLGSTGQYVVFKYRMSEISASVNAVEIFTSTESMSPAGPDNTDYYFLEHDGEWHVVVLDISKLLPKYCVKGEGDEYLLNYLRFDFFHGQGLSEEIHYDIAYIGICDSMEKVCEFNKDMKEIHLLESTDKQITIDPKTGTPITE